MQSFAYAAPETVEQALEVLGEHVRNGRRAQVLAGGGFQAESPDRAGRVSRQASEAAQARCAPSL